MAKKDYYDYLFDNLQENYTEEEAADAVRELLKKYGTDISLHFRENAAEILGSFRVTSRRDRLLVSEIIRRSGRTARSAENLAAEWRLHNLSYRLGYKKAQARDAALDYTKDPRLPVRLLAGVLDMLDSE